MPSEFERYEFPSRKTRRLGLSWRISLGATSVSTFRLACSSRHAELPLPFRDAGLSRYRLDQSLLQAAEKHMCSSALVFEAGSGAAPDAGSRAGERIRAELVFK
jgi:hypothetical protein